MPFQIKTYPAERSGTGAVIVLRDLRPAVAVEGRTVDELRAGLLAHVGKLVEGGLSNFACSVIHVGGGRKPNGFDARRKELEVATFDSNYAGPGARAPRHATAPEV